MCPQYPRLQHLGSVFGRSQQGAVMAEKRRRSCQDRQDALAGDNGSEDTSLRGSDSMRIWSRREGLHIHASVSSASSYLRSWLGRWSWARSAALAGKSLVQEGLDPATKNRALGMGSPTSPRSGCLPLVHRVRIPPLRNLPGAQARSMAPVQDVRTRNQCSGRNARTHTQPPDL